MANIKSAIKRAKLSEERRAHNASIKSDMRSAVKTGDRVTTIGGIVGTVVDVKEKNIVLETGADQVRIEFEKWAISSNYTATAAAKEQEKKAQEAKAKAKAAKKAGN